MGRQRSAAEMNVPQRLADDMLAIEPEDNRILTKAELKSYHLAGVDPVEQQSRAVAKEARTSKKLINLV